MDNVIQFVPRLQLAPRLTKSEGQSSNATVIEAIRLSLTESANRLRSSIASLNDTLGAIESVSDSTIDAKSRDELLLKLELARLELLLETRKSSRMVRNEQREI